MQRLALYEPYDLLKWHFRLNFVCTAHVVRKRLVLRTIAMSSIVRFIVHAYTSPSQLAISST